MYENNRERKVALLRGERSEAVGQGTIDAEGVCFFNKSGGERRWLVP